MTNKLFPTLKFFVFILVFAASSCTLLDNETSQSEGNTQSNVKTSAISVPNFNADSAYAFVQKQVDFGPRVPNTPAQKACASWLENQLALYGAKTYRQEAKVTAFDGSKLDMINIIGSFQPEKKDRVLLFAHWDTRPFADKDTSRVLEPIDGANDGGSGVGVLLEIARILQTKPTNIGIDIIFFDTEDYGSPSGIEGTYTDWCLGSQYWSKNPHIPGYDADYGILLDMVGGKDAVFPREGTSLFFAPQVVRTIWRDAASLGYGNYFIKENTQQTTDDHLFVSRDANIPSACIVEFHPSTGTYGTFHHTHQDNMDVISKETLKAVGQTLLKTIYSEE